MSDSQVPSVLFLLSTLRLGGSESKTVRLANALAERNIRVTLAYLKIPDFLRDQVAPEVRLVHLRRRGKLSLRALGALVRLIRDRNVSTVITVNLYPALYAALARFGRRKYRPRFIALVNTTEVSTWKLAAQMHLYRRVLPTADMVIFGAEAQRRLWRERYGVGLGGQETRVIYNGVDTRRFAPAPETPGEKHPAASKHFVIGSVGQLRPEKSHVDVIRATALLRSRGLDVQTLLVGEGPERPRIEATIAQLGITAHVKLVGETRDVLQYLHAMHVFVLSSIAIETFPNAALEALASGIPVVASEVGGIRELLAFGGGLTYPAGDVEALAARVSHLLQDPEARLRMGTAARIAAVERFSWNRMVQDFTDLLVTTRAVDAPLTLASASSVRKLATRG